MEKVKLKALDLGASELLSREEQSIVFGSGSGSGSGSASGSGSGSFPSGSLESLGQEKVGTAFFAPIGVNAVKFTCYGNAALFPFFTCTTKALNTPHSGIGVGAQGTGKEIVVPVAASNTNVSITFQTTDSYGVIVHGKLLCNEFYPIYNIFIQCLCYYNTPK